jgi:pSer/pThr/pTyr-binding forkhead associated (FHA) protein
MGSIFVISGVQKGEYLSLGHRTNVIGRAETLPLQILDDMVSRKHLRVGFDASTNTYYAEDMNSKNGVFINGRRISEQISLIDGDQILIGQTALLFSEREFGNVEHTWAYFQRIVSSVPTRVKLLRD